MLARMDGEAFGRGLLEAFAQVPDPRRPRGRRHPLAALLALSAAAMLSGARSLYAIAQWGRLQPSGVVRALGFTRERTPSVRGRRQPGALRGRPAGDGAQRGANIAAALRA